MLLQRTLTSLTLLVLIGIVFFILPNVLFAVVIWLICLIAIYEMTRMYKFSMVQISLLLFVNSAIVFAINKINYDLSQLIRLIAVITWCFIAPFILIFVPQKFSKLIIAVLATILFIPVYYALIILQALLGPWQLISIMAIAWVADTGAYFIGKNFGKHKLAPHISPGKSIEGAIGGAILVVSYLMLLKYFNLALYLPTIITTVKFALILTIVSIMGDLFESWLKRVAKVKDSSKILPGHGGVFDRIDSLIAVVVIAYALILGMLQ